MSAGVNRRGFLGGLLAAGTSAALGPGRVALGATTPGPRKKPRALLLFHISGGVDALLFSDPKRRSEVESNVDIPYQPNDIVSLPNGEFGPLVPVILGKHARRFAFLNGVESSTVAHQVGSCQAYQLHRGIFPDRFSSIGPVLASRLPHSSPMDVFRHGPRGFAGNAIEVVGARGLRVENETLPELHRLEAGRRALMVKALKARASRCSSTLDCSPYGAVASLLNRLASLPPPTKMRLQLDVSAAPAGFATPMRKKRMRTFAEKQHSFVDSVLYSVQHDLAPVHLIELPVNFDSHAQNKMWQWEATLATAPAMIGLFDALEAVPGRNARSLLDEIGIVVLSDVGRFPILNDWDGKDHLPQLPVWMAGPGIRAGVYGATDRRVLARSISLQTGLPGRKATHKMTLDDIGTTVFEWFGIGNPEIYGYSGKRLPFVFS